MPGAEGRVLHKSHLVYGSCTGKGLWVPGTVSSLVTLGKQAHTSVPVTQLHACLFVLQ